MLNWENYFTVYTYIRTSPVHLKYIKFICASYRNKIEKIIFLKKNVMSKVSYLFKVVSKQPYYLSSRKKWVCRDWWSSEIKLMQWKKSSFYNPYFFLLDFQDINRSYRSHINVDLWFSINKHQIIFLYQ